MSTSQEPLLVSADKLAEMMQISTRSVWRMLSKGEVIEPVRFGRNTRWVYEDVKEWVSQGCPPPSKIEK